jgi:ATP-binding cassette subfamily F protein uup
VWQAESKQAAQTRTRGASPDPSSTNAISKRPQGSAKKKLSYLEAREYEEIEERVAEAEHVLQAKRVQLEDPAIATDASRLVSANAELENAQHTVDTLYARWAALERKKT